MARSAERTVTLILDASDELADLEELRRLHSRPYGQVLCEPDPTTTPTGLARHILVALGKHRDMAGSASPWPAVECHLKGERVRDLVLARAHTLTYAGLRRVADHAHAAGAHLWLWSATERPTPALSQLLEARPYDRGTIDDLLDRWRRPPPEPEHGLPPIPDGAGENYPWLTPCCAERLRSRTALTASLNAADRRRVAETWINASEWTDAWLADHPDAADQDLADALGALTAAGDTASEQITRTQAALVKLHRHGTPVSRTLITRDHTLTYGESRPHQWRDAVSRAAQLANQAADPHDAALIALSAIFRDPYTTIRVRIADVTSDGAITRAPWGRPRAVPPQLRPALAIQYYSLDREPAAIEQPFLPGTTRGHMTEPAIEHAMDRLDVPTSMWRSAGVDDEFGDGPRLDGRMILARLNPISLFQAHDR